MYKELSYRLGMYESSLYKYKKGVGYFNFCKYLRKMGKEYSQLNFIYDWSIIFFIMLLVLIFVMGIGGIVRNRKIIHRKEVALLVLMIVIIELSGVLFLLELMDIIHAYFLCWPLILPGLGAICCGYLIKYQEEVAKMGRKKIFISTMSSKEVFVMAGLVISLGVCLAILIHL